MKRTQPTKASRQRGVVLLFALIVLVILLAGGVAVVRSMNASLSSAGNLAFKRDLVNQGEQAAANALALFKTGALAGSGTDVASRTASNYSAVRLATNARGIPSVLLDDSTFSTVGVASNDVTNDGVRVRYVIDRMCNALGAASDRTCVYAPSLTDVRGGSAQQWQRPPPSGALVYRLSIRVDGPRNTQAFLQSSFTKPE